ncbi:hypothetical protein HPB48_007480 [Haemaphysalis longicornis]|uniref:Otopetrin n=1 Tax=Haemaphysalis longicornis TaxID=44386 RepID=A0A9J6G5X6_HAELO|nr:hypothetical protein HPB48_007480 [Haemaphysalis longicornis]
MSDSSEKRASDAARELRIVSHAVPRRVTELALPTENFQLDSFVGSPEIAEYRKTIRTTCCCNLHAGTAGCNAAATRGLHPCSSSASYDKGCLRLHDHRRLQGRSFSMDFGRRQNESMLWSNLTSLLSYIYATFVVVFGAVMTVLQPSIKIGSHNIEMDDAFACVMCILGLAWLVFLHGDISWQKARRCRQPSGASEGGAGDTESTVTADALDWKGSRLAEPPGYTYLTGRHSGSFFLKAGMTVFCCGHLIHEGLLLGQEIIAWMHAGKVCTDTALLLVHTLRPLFSFYQLFFLFKYSNIVINRWVTLAKWGIMHCFATTLTFWIRTIVNDAYGDVVKASKGKVNNSLALWGNLTFSDLQVSMSERHGLIQEANWTCAVADLFSPAYMRPMPYLYPFTIEFNLCLAGVWFIVLQNLGTSAQKQKPCCDVAAAASRTVPEEVSENNLVINADCHSANRGLFAGIVVLLASIVVMVIFYCGASGREVQPTGVSVYLAQVGVLLLLAFIACLLAYGRIATLDINGHPITMLDDFLLCIPMPFYFAHATLVVIAEMSEGGSYERMLLQIFTVVQVVTQTPLIIDGLRRCSNSPALRYKKPGREVVSFLIVLNITMWIVYTFESKTVGKVFVGMQYFGLRAWVFVEHTTVPLMLFYRFHSSVCLSDIWKSAYEAE